MLSADDLKDINVSSGAQTPVLEAGVYTMKLIEVRRIQLKIAEKYLKDDGVTHKPGLGFIFMPTDDSMPMTEIWVKKTIAFGKQAALPKWLKQLDRRYSQKLQDSFSFSPEKLANYINSLTGKDYYLEVEPSEDGKWNNVISVRAVLAATSGTTEAAHAPRNGSAEKVPTAKAKAGSPKATGFEGYPDADELPF